VGGHETLRYEGKPLLLAHLGDVLELPHCNGQRSIDQRISVVILSAAEKRMAFVVDELVNEQELVTKGLGRQLTHVGGIASASVMGSGEVILILQVADLFKLAQHNSSRPVRGSDEPTETVHVAQTRPQPHILVVDDSITTRTLEKNILEAAGYEVQLANDGLEAINLVLSSDLPDLIISDIAMPRLDGFELTRKLKHEARTNRIPVILVTSLDSSQDKARGIEAGADAYIVKSSFDQNNLLETIEQLI
jgi:two-component system chemotaxis sensor kinase CheA